ncbi:SO2930 family diheme c-type cytochrome [Sphingobacterium kyonggiense]|uniref:SO2930 family diheme c-type cytochrome n=1 Tax=Sphingobacterium kyonggiense TaxID=714075 RepID=UPI0031D85D5D
MKKYSIALACCFLLIYLLQACLNQQKPQASTSSEYQFKDKLSDYAFFKGNLVDLIPNEHLINYDLSSALFTDYAIKDRYIVLPTGKKMKFINNEELDFPDSTMIIKNFSYRNQEDQIIRIETRLMFKDPADHQWKVMNYLWNEQQTDALKHIRGASLPISLKDDQGKMHQTNYMVPNTNDCKRCHIRDSKLIPIGPKARNMNYTRTGQKQNQLAKLAEDGHLSNLPDLQSVEVLPNWIDKANYSLEQRARAYLDINCAHCHRTGGDAFNTGLFLSYNEADTVRLGYYKGPVSAGSGAGGLDYDLVPGHPDKSILYYRMNSTEPGTAMPELARTLIHQEGVDLIKSWIKELK